MKNMKNKIYLNDGTKSDCMLKKKVIPLLFSCVLFLIFLHSAEAWAGGNGSSEGPWQIDMCSDLNDIGNNYTYNLSDHYVLITDLDCKGGEYWIDNIPVDKYYNGFNYLDGQGHTIKNIVVDRSRSMVGLIGYLNGDLINLNVVNCSFSGSGKVGVVGRGLFGHLTNVSSVNNTVIGTGNMVGGIIGDSDYCYLKKSYSYNNYVEGEGSVGGLAGKFHCGSHMYQSYSRDNEVYATWYMAGGLCGFIDLSTVTVNNAYAVGNKVSSRHTIGGLAGFVSRSQLNYTYSAGNVLNFSVGSPFAGLISKMDEGAFISDSYSDKTNNPSDVFDSVIEPANYSCSVTDNHSYCGGGDFDIANYTIEELGWDPNVWSKNSHGYPILKNVGGNQEFDYERQFASLDLISYPESAGNMSSFRVAANISCQYVTGCNNIDIALDPLIEEEKKESWWGYVLSFFNNLITGLAVGEIIPEGSGDPFYTTSSNPLSMNLSQGESRKVSWDVYVNASALGEYDFFAFLNSTDDYIESEHWKLNISKGAEKHNITIQPGNFSVWMDEGEDFMLFNQYNDYTGIKHIHIKDVLSEDIVLEFSHDFNHSNMDYNLSIERAPGHIIIEGFDSDKELTAYFPKATKDTVCVREQEIEEISQISEDCSDSEEIFHECDGSLVNGINCSRQEDTDGYVSVSDSADYFIIEGAGSFAAAEREEEEETDTGSSGGSSSSGGGGSSSTVCRTRWECTEWGECINNIQKRTCVDVNKCTVLTSAKPLEIRSCGCKENWKCTDWEPAECPPNQTQTRECNDYNFCGTTKNKPAETKRCAYFEEEEEDPFSANISETDVVRESPRNTVFAVVVIGIPIILLLIVFTIDLIRNRKP